MNEVVAQDVNRDGAVVQGQENERDILEEVEDSARGVDSVEEKNEIMDDVQIVNVEGEQEEEDWPVPDLSGDEEDRKALIEQQKKDKTLESVRKWANAGEKGFGVQDGIIVHNLECEHGEVWRRVVVPKEHRKDILSHSSLTGGHFSVRKTEGMLRHVFTWPGVTRDVKAWCRSCPECQEATRAVNCKALLPVISTPFSGWLLIW